MAHTYTTCERCHKKFIYTDSIPKFVVCETSSSYMFTRGYSLWELDLCPNCTAALENFMREGGYGLDGDDCDPD